MPTMPACTMRGKTSPRISTSLGALALLLLGACDVFAPATELEVINDLDVQLAVRAAPCGLALEAFASLAPGQSRTRSVESGCWRVEAWTDDGRFGGVTVEVPYGTIHRVPFYDEDAAR